MVSGSEQEPPQPPDQVVEQMREVTQKLRDQAWMVASLTRPVAPQAGACEDAEITPDA